MFLFSSDSCYCNFFSLLSPLSFWNPSFFSSSLVDSRRVHLTISAFFCCCYDKRQLFSCSFACSGLKFDICASEVTYVYHKDLSFNGMNKQKSWKRCRNMKNKCLGDLHCEMTRNKRIITHFFTILISPLPFLLLAVAATSLIHAVLCVVCDCLAAERDHRLLLYPPLSVSTLSHMIYSLKESERV